MKILLLIKQPYPYGAAYSTRARALASIFCALGYTVTVVCSAGGESEKEHAYFESHPDISRVIIPERNGSIQVLIEAWEYGRAVERLICTGEYSLIVSSSMQEKIGSILRSARKHGVPVILESCEWYHKTSWKFGAFDPRYWVFEYAWRRHFPKADGYIVISHLLADHYEKTGKRVVRIPTITDIEATEPRLTPSNNDDRINLLFAGRFGGTKDDVAPIARAIVSSDDLISKFRLVIVGPTREEVFARESEDCCFARLEAADALRVTGRIPQEQVAEEYRQADFGCFIRPVRRSSNAGFSTKLGEGMAVGTPFVVNDTGDITEYVENGVSGIVFEDTSPDHIAAILERIASSSQEERMSMRTEARSIAEHYFDWRAYTSDVSQLLDEVKEAYCA